jgi:mono/diheme cytochrome c family protein
MPLNENAARHVIKPRLFFAKKSARKTAKKIAPCLLLGLLLLSLAPAAFAEAVVPGLSLSKLDPTLKGQVLIEEFNCAACHTSDQALSTRSKQAPRLSEIGSRVNPHYVEAFINDPHGTKPGTTMPDALASLSPEAKKQAATSITHYLFSHKKNDFSLQAPDIVAAKEGMRLFHSRGCANCHASRDALGAELNTNNSASLPVPLGALDKKYSFKSLVNFLRQPHASRPSGRMPDMRLSGQDLERITHFLLQKTQVPAALAYTFYRGQVWEGLHSDKVTAERAGHAKDFSIISVGIVQQHTAIKYDGWINITNQGRYTFFITMNGGSLVVDGKQIIQQDPSDRRGVKQLEGGTELTVGWKKLQLTYFHTGREAKFICEMAGPQFERQTIPSSMLSISNNIIPAFEPLTVDPELAVRGREHFGKFGCANCHNDLQVPVTSSTAFSKLNSNRGCLSTSAGPWPHFDITKEQRSLITTALPQAEHPQLDDKQRLNKTLITFNCIACHERSGLGGLTPEHYAHFTGTQPILGDQGRLPPPLTHVGAKLKPEWLRDVLLNGKRQRDYLDASMPQYGEAQVGHLVELFGQVDRLETAPIAKIADIQASKEAGREMIGAAGLSCIACHTYNGQKSGEVAALDLVHVTERLQKNWFHLYLRQPVRFHPTVIMPSYWPNGQSMRPTTLGGDSAQQIEALWAYLEDGTKAKKPSGLSRQSNELRVSDLAEICRGHGPAGFRGIAVGYPERINLTFDSEEMTLRQLWKNDFANVDLGSFRPRGTDLISFPPGIPFHRLKSLDDNWPYKGKTNHGFPQNHGYQFRGYHLHAKRRPTFLYHYGDIAVEDYFEDVPGEKGKPYFKRTFTFITPTEDTATEQVPFSFRAAAGKKVTTISPRQFTIDQLQLRIISEHQGKIREGDPSEVLILLTLPKGRTTFTLEYQW